MAEKIVFTWIDFNPNTFGLNLELGLSNGEVGGSQKVEIFSGVDPNNPNQENLGWPKLFTPIGDKLIFEVQNATNGRELWVTDGTPGGTEILLDINAVAPTDTHSSFLRIENYNSINDGDRVKPLVVDNIAYFAADDGVHGFEVWKTDGTPGGTQRVTDLNPNAASAAPNTFVEFNGEVYFVAKDSTNRFQIWKTDGTTTTKITSLVAASGAGTDPANANPFNLFVSGDDLYFKYYDGDPTHQDKLYVTDGTVNAEHVLQPSHPNYGDFRNFADINGTLYFAQDDRVNGLELWKSDGTEGGTVMIKDINPIIFPGSPPSPQSSVPIGFIEYNGFIYFAANDGSHGTEVWRTDGQVGGVTEMVADINLTPLGPGTEGGVFLPFFTEFNGWLYFNATDGQSNHGQELWRTNGTTTEMVADLNPGTASGNPVMLQVHNGALYFGSQVTTNNTQHLFKYDGVNPPVAISTNYQYGAGYEPFFFINVNTPPTQNANTGATVNEGQSGTIGNAQLDYDDAEQGNGQITYTVTALTANGTLFKNGVALALNGTFTQADIVNNLITYTHNGGETTTDQFGFSVSDGVAPTITGQTFAITVTPQNDPPAITSDGGGATANLNRPENATAVTTVTATDPDSSSFTYSIVGGSDFAKFEINATTGVLKFITAPNFEAPGDADANNSYIVQVRVSDGSANDVQTITVNVTDVALELAKKNDFNADGKADILWQHDNGVSSVWTVNSVNSATTGPLLPNPNAGDIPVVAPHPWREIDTGDFNGDGKTDILWQHASGTPSVWLMDGSNVLSTGPVLSNPGPSWHAIATGDFNGDFKSDILWQDDTGAPAVWLMNGVNVLSAGPVLSNPGPTWKVKDAGDFNGDGKADILWQNLDGTAAVWLMDGVNRLAAGPTLPNPGASWHVEAAGDFNGDGKADILWQNADGTPAVWLMDGVNVLATGPLLSNPGSSWHVKEAADANGDGKADIFWQNDNGTPSIWLMDGVNVSVFGSPLSNPGAGWHIV